MLMMFSLLAIDSLTLGFGTFVFFHPRIGQGTLKDGTTRSFYLDDEWQPFHELTPAEEIGFNGVGRLFGLFVGFAGWWYLLWFLHWDPKKAKPF